MAQCKILLCLNLLWQWPVSCNAFCVVWFERNKSRVFQLLLAPRRDVLLVVATFLLLQAQPSKLPLIRARTKKGRKKAHKYWDRMRNDSFLSATIWNVGIHRSLLPSLHTTSIQHALFRFLYSILHWMARLNSVLHHLPFYIK